MNRSYVNLFFLITLIACSGESGSPVVADSSAKIDTPRQILPPIAHYTPADLSPMDMIYYPVEYAKMKSAYPESPPPVARIIYSRPQKQGRKIFGGLVKYGEPWRLGANESTEIEFFSPVTIQNKRIKAGRYILYCIPEETKWTLVLNSNLYSWGLKLYREKDLMKFEIPAEKNDLPIEYFTMAFEKSADGMNLLIMWDTVKTVLPISFK